MRTTTAQFKMMVDYMEANGDLCKAQNGPRGKLWALKGWAMLTERLNIQALGEPRSADKWRKVWSDFKIHTKKKSLRMSKEAQEGSGEPQLRLSPLEQRVLNIMDAPTASQDDTPIQVWTEQKNDTTRRPINIKKTVRPQALTGLEKRVLALMNTASAARSPAAGAVPSPLPPMQAKVEVPSPPASSADELEPEIEEYVSEDWRVEEPGGSQDPLCDPPAAVKRRAPKPSTVAAKRLRGAPSRVDEMAERFFAADEKMREFQRETMAWQREREMERERQRDVELENQRQFLSLIAEITGLAKKYLERNET